MSHVVVNVEIVALLFSESLSLRRSQGTLTHDDVC